MTTMTEESITALFVVGNAKAIVSNACHLVNSLHQLAQTFDINNLRAILTKLIIRLSIVADERVATEEPILKKIYPSLAASP